MLVILAHPDDETAIGPMLAMYARTNKVYYVVATDGRYGTRVFKTAEDTLIMIRANECQCSCSKLGIQPPFLLGFHDEFGLKTGIGEYFRQTKALKDSLIQKFELIKPDVVITFGPDGDTGHPDHRIIGSIVTEVILKEGWYHKYPLYYLGWTKSQAAKFGIEDLNYLQEKYFTTATRFTQEDEKKSFESIRCYQSQNTNAEIQEWIKTEANDTANVLYFRKFEISPGKSTF